MCSFRWALIGSLLFPCLAAAQTPQSAPGTQRPAPTLHQFHDPVNGVTFRYPAVWQLNQGGGSYFPPVILTKNNGAAEADSYYQPTAYVALVGRDAKGGTYENTNFINGWFFYRIPPELSETQCYQQASAGSGDDDWKLERTTIGGLGFQHGSGAEAGLCNEATEDVYTTFHGGRCYLFEKQIDTICPGSEGRDITPRELAQINRAFDAVVQSVRLTDVSATKNPAPPRQVVQTVKVPFVGCASDGQVGPRPAPAPESISIALPADAAQRLAFYKAAVGIGTLAPRGWHCFSTYGSAGSSLYVTPEPIDHKALLSSNWKGFSGQAIQVSISYGGKSGRFEVAKTIARVFPNHLAFVQNVTAEGIEPANSFPTGPYPTDKLVYRSKEIVEFETPPNTKGLGTDSMLRVNASMIRGVAILFGEETNLAFASLRLPPTHQNLFQPIIDQVEKQTAAQATAAGPQSIGQTKTGAPFIAKR